ncbi:MAG TPA: zf-HC2 domain-containing protein [Blastocatellia bacterium]|nr:zf-HC2 domain-containing protein [Blastocatellia bacterium]
MGIKDLIEHLTKKQVDDYCRQQLGVAELLSVSDHLDECEACRQRVEYAINGEAAFFALRAELFGEAADISSPGVVRAHLTSEQAAGYVDRNLSGEELQSVADHLTGCDECALIIDDLDAFKNRVAPLLGREYRPSIASSRTEGFWGRMAGSLPALSWRSPGLAFGAALAVVLLAVTGWLVWRTQPQTGPKEEIAVAPSPSPEPSPSPPIAEPVAEPVAELVAQLNDGQRQLTLDRDGNLSGADDLPPAYRDMLKEALATPRVERSPHLKGLTRPPSSLMSTDKERSEFSVIEPVGRVLVTARPTFRWSPLEGASGYVVEVYDSKFDLVATSPQLTAQSWTVPQSLAPGRVYSWQVKAVKDGQDFRSPSPPAAQARFRILDRAKANELARARRAYPSSHLTLGLLYAEAGLLEEAEQELRLLQKANPDSKIARSLLSQVQALRRRSR